MTTISLKRAALEVGPYMQYLCHAFIAEIGIKYTKTLLCKARFSFLWGKNVFSACFVRSFASCNANAKDLSNIMVLFVKSPNF